MKKSLRLTWRKAFTLIELLVVISIIAVLAGLAFPALQGALDTAKKAQASTMCNQLATGVTMYNTEYGTWPAPSTQTTEYKVETQSDWENMDIALNGNKKITDGTTGTSTIPNTRAIQFMSFNKKDLVTTSSQAIRTPVTKADKTSGKVGSPDRWYHMILDCDYDGVVTVPDLTSTSGATTKIGNGVGVWCYGDNNGTDNSKKLASYR